MRKVKIVDTAFDTPAATCRGYSPAYFEWDKTPGYASTKFFSDAMLEQAAYDGSRKKIAILWECPFGRPDMYRDIIDMPWFDYVLTWNMSLLSLGGRYMKYIFGGTWIPLTDWYWKKDKYRECSIIYSEKLSHPGHKIRHACAEYVAAQDRYGRGYNRPIKSKVEALSPYRYSIIVENEKLDYWITEKLIDCFSQGTVPIYWGCPSIGDIFDMDGIITFDDPSELPNIISKLSEHDYNSRRYAIKKNYWRAWEYKCPEDWWFINYYKELFT